MNDYAKGLPQDRKRLWLSSKRLGLVRYEGEKMSTFDALAAKKGWKKGELRWQMGSWGQRKPITKPAYTVTSGQHFMGSETLGGFNVTHIPNSDDRATLQGMPPIKFPVSMAETTRRYHVAAAVPPPFALLVSQEACAYQQQSIQEHKVTKQVLRVQIMGEAAVAAKAAELGIVPDIKAPEKPEFTLDRGPHGIWEYWGENLGFKHQAVPIVDHIMAVSDKPWVIRHKAWFTYPGILRDTWVSSRIPDPGPNTFTFSRSCKVVRHTARYLVVLSDSTQKTAHAKTFQSAREAAPSTQSSHIHRRHARQDLCRFNQPDTTPQPQVRRRRRRV